MARTFDIRFARSDGIAALLETPANTFRWRGDGSLRIDGSRLDIQRKRGLHSLLARQSHFRIHAADLREVTREGDALRIEFGVPGSRRVVLPFWVRDRAEAAEIVRLMPTDRTVESEEPVENSTSPRRFRFDWRRALQIFFALGIAASAALLVRGFRSAALEPASVPAAAPSAIAVESPVVETVAPAEEMDIARRQQILFESELKVLRNAYFSLVGRGDAEALERLEPRWWSVRFRIEASEPLSGPAFTGFREGQLAIVSSWTAAVSLHAAGLRLKDERFIELAEKQRDLAEQQEQIVRRYVR
jgi:hypothetical protein